MGELEKEIYALFEKYGYTGIIVDEKRSFWDKRLVFVIKAYRPRAIERTVTLTFTD